MIDNNIEMDVSRQAFARPDQLQLEAEGASDGVQKEQKAVGETVSGVGAKDGEAGGGSEGTAGRRGLVKAVPSWRLVLDQPGDG
jgi:hypothetical protein